MTPGHLIARLQFTFHSDEDLDHLKNAWWQLVATLKLFNLVIETLFKNFNTILEGLFQFFNVRHHLIIGDHNLAPLSRCERRQHVFRNHFPSLNSLGA